MTEPIALELRRASTSDASDVLEILDEACRWLTSRGIEQWADRFQPTWIEPALERGETWLAYRVGTRLGSRPVGTITLSWSDAAWCPDDARGGYVHRIAVRRDAAGLGLRLLDWAKAQCADHGRRYLRLDCVSTNGALRRYYETRGFVHVRDLVVQGPPADREQCDLPGRETTVSLYQFDLGGGDSVGAQASQDT